MTDKGTPVAVLRRVLGKLNEDTWCKHMLQMYDEDTGVLVEGKYCLLGHLRMEVLGVVDGLTEEAERPIIHLASILGFSTLWDVTVFNDGDDRTLDDVKQHLSEVITRLEHQPRAG